jgi:hypothetical protein
MFQLSVISYQLSVINYQHLDIFQIINFKISKRATIKISKRATTRVAPTEWFVGATLAHALKLFL